jgi:hypothetical protein
MALSFNKAFAAALMCGAIGFAGTAFAQGAYGGASGPAGASNNAAVGSSATTTETPNFLGKVQSKSTPAKGLSQAATARVNQQERRITAELNRASAASTGNATASSQATIGGGPITQ